MADDIQMDILGGGIPVADVARVDVPRPPRRTRGDRQRQAILRGIHPLTGAAVNVLAPADATDPAAVGLRCGSCDRLAQRLSANGKTYPKCTGHSGRYLTHGEATDVRAWWPACPSHTPRPKEERR